ncbi:glucan biosynthesis protein [Flaviflagellibacter deserti]|uniref:Glucans biosynthesis protein G n=1 Tax=Flaviflagellibacter deserti TaxID=2267266 RepID=A0ABV9YX71_9HYPH
MRRRDLILGAAALPFGAGLFAQLAEIPLAQTGDAAPFNASQVRQIARDMASKPYKAPDTGLPDELKDLPYDRYRDLRFVPERAIWRGEGLPFEVQLFHRGFLYSNRVDIFVVAEGQARPLVYSRDLFTFGQVTPPPPNVNLGFAGFRLHGPINRPDYYDEIAAFLGASYFRSLAKGQGYGLSARGLAINTASPEGEEFPVFRSFWIERPAKGTSSIVVHALLDSKSASASYRFTIRPGDTTIFDVEMAIYPRQDVEQAGLGPLTSMFFFGPNDRSDVDDFRSAVHDSDGLALWNGRGERLWRPLTNPNQLQISVFGDANPRGFGLMQRHRNFWDFDDLEARYEKRPSLWIEPIGDWGEGAVYLVEIPTKEEIHDNIAAFWRPKEPLRKGAEYLYNYRMHWCGPNPFDQSDLLTFHDTRMGAAGDNRLFVIDIAGARIKDLQLDDQVKPVISANPGKLSNVVLQPNSETGGWRLSFQLDPDDEPLVEMRAQLFRADQPLSEVWIYRWTA